MPRRNCCSEALPSAASRPYGGKKYQSVFVHLYMERPERTGEKNATFWTCVVSTLKAMRAVLISSDASVAKNGGLVPATP